MNATIGFLVLSFGRIACRKAKESAGYAVIKGKSATIYSRILKLWLFDFRAARLLESEFVK